MALYRTGVTGGGGSIPAGIGFIEITDPENCKELLERVGMWDHAEETDRWVKAFTGVISMGQQTQKEEGDTPGFPHVSATILAVRGSIAPISKVTKTENGVTITGGTFTGGQVQAGVTNVEHTVALANINATDSYRVFFKVR